MHTRTKKLLVLVMVAALVCTTTGFPAFAQDQTRDGEGPSAEAMIADFLILRPLGFAAFLVGTAFFIVSLPFSWPGGNAGEARHHLMEKPASFTFARPLGQLDY